VTEKKSRATKGTKSGGRSESAGPTSATPNELKQGRKGRGGKGASPNALPRTGKSEVGRGDSEGGGLH
jgi:hypothetical protein